MNVFWLNNIIGYRVIIVIKSSRYEEKRSISQTEKYKILGKFIYNQCLAINVVWRVKVITNRLSPRENKSRTSKRYCHLAFRGRAGGWESAQSKPKKPYLQEVIAHSKEISFPSNSYYDTQQQIVFYFHISNITLQQYSRYLPERLWFDGEWWFYLTHERTPLEVMTP